MVPDENLCLIRKYADAKLTAKIIVVQINNVLKFVRGSLSSTVFVLKLAEAGSFLSLSDFFKASRI